MSRPSAAQPVRGPSPGRSVPRLDSPPRNTTPVSTARATGATMGSSRSPRQPSPQSAKKPGTDGASAPVSASPRSRRPSFGSDGGGSPRPPARRQGGAAGERKDAAASRSSTRASSPARGTPRQTIPPPEAAESVPAAVSLDEAITLGANLEGLPHRPKSIESTRQFLEAHAPQLTLVFLHYARMSGVGSLREATRLRLVGLQQLARDSLLDNRDFDLNAIGRVLATHIEDTGRRNSATSLKDTGPKPEHAELRLEQFLRLFVQLAFCSAHPRHGHALFDAPRPNQIANQANVLAKIDETTAVPNALQKCLENCLPRMRGSEGAEYRLRLEDDTDAQSVLASYAPQIEAWAAKLRTSLAAMQVDPLELFDPLELWSRALDAKRCLGTVSVPITDRNGDRKVFRASLSAAQARVCFLEAQTESEALALGKPVSMFETSVLIEALARCGEVKYGGVAAMDGLGRCVGAMVRNIIGKANEVEVLTEAVVGKDTAAPGDIAERREEARASNWERCWKHMVFKDLTGWPMWEAQLHDALEPHFADLQSIFVHYCGSSIQGSESISSATKIGIMEMLTFARDTALCTRYITEDELSRHFAVANAQSQIASSGSAERHHRQAGGSSSARNKPKYYDPIAEAIAKREKRDAPPQDMQLNLFEFINFLVRVAFWRCNPQWGSKFNKRDLTPVPESVTILMQGMLPRAKRDTSAEFREVMANDDATQLVLSEFREPLHDWLRLALRKDSGKADTLNNSASRLTYGMWVSLMDGPDAAQLKPGAARAACPKMVGEWDVKQESDITGDERTLPRVQQTISAKLSIPQVRWNFLRSQAVEQLGESEVDDDSEYASLDFAELQEALVRCAVDMFEKPMAQWLNSHERYVFTRAEAVRAFLRVLLWEATVEHVMWEATLIKASRYDASDATILPKQTPTEFALFCSCWKTMPLMDVYGFPLWEKGVHDCIQANFVPLMRVFSHYTKGISGIDSAADALEMELEEFHDFVKDAKLETRLVRFDAMGVVFAKANATNTADVYEQRKRERRDNVVQAGLEENARNDKRRSRSPAHRRGGKPPPEYEGEYAPVSRSRRPDNRLTLTEFIQCLVRLSFMRANPKHGTYDNKSRVVPLPDCLEAMVEHVLAHAKQDQSALFREALAVDEKRQAVLRKYDAELRYWLKEVTRLTADNGKKNKGCLTMSVYLDIVRGFLTFHRKPDYSIEKAAEGGYTMKRHSGSRGESAGMSKWAVVGDCTVQRESDITGDERCKQTFTCRLTVLESKYAFLNSQSLEQMRATESGNDDAMATLDFDEFCECLARLSDAKYGEIKLIPPESGLQGLIENLMGRASDEAVIRDATYIFAERFDWAESRPLPGQSLAMHRRWRNCWENVEIADLHQFPLWEKGVHDTLQPVFSELHKIFAHYAKGATGGETAEDAVEMTMSEFKVMVKDVGLETHDFRWDVMQNMFKKANALNSNESHFQRKAEAGNADVKTSHSGGVGSKVKVLEERSRATSKRAQSQKDTEMDAELVLYEFVEVLVRIAFWRANPYHGIIKLATKLVPLPECLHQMLHDVILPNATRDDSEAFRERLRADPHLQAALRTVEPSLRPWFNVHTQSIYLRVNKRALQFQQWQTLLKKGWGTCAPGTAGAQVGYSPGFSLGTWEIYQDSEITGDDRCRQKHSCGISFPVAKLAFINSQDLDQMTVGQAKATDDMLTLDYTEFEECVARCALYKYQKIEHPIDGPMREPAMITAFVANLLGEETTEESMNTITLIKCPRFDWRRIAKPLPGQDLGTHKRWLGVWQRLEFSDLHFFPIWEQALHDVLQKHFRELSLIFLAYSRSVLGSDSAEDATEMEMAEFYDFVSECHLETKQVNFDRMTNDFIKVNATNSAQAREAHHDARRSAGTKRDAKAAEVARVKGTNSGEEAVKDAELVLYEFIALLVRISFQRANPTFGNFGSDKKAVVHLPGCLERMLEEEVLPRARRDTSAVFRETVMAEISVQAVLTEYEPLLKKYYKRVTEKDAEYFDASDEMGMEQWLRICDQLDLVGRWECHRESDITGDPAARTRYEWSLSMNAVKLAFADSQDKEGELGAGQTKAGEGITTLSYPEWCECLARLGIDKFRAVKEVAPAQAVRGFIQNLLGEKSSDAVVIEATCIRAEPFDYATLAHPLKGDKPADFAKWLECWKRIELMDMHLWPLWEKEVHDILQPLFKELQLVFLAYTRSISEDSAEDAMEMSMDEFHDFVVDVGLETKTYKFEVMQNQFIKANAVNVAAVRAAHKESRKNSTARAYERETKPNETLSKQNAGKNAGSLKGTSDGKEAVRDQELVLYEFLNMLVRISFWRANPTFGNWVDKDGDGVKDKEDWTPIPAALTAMLNEIVLPRAKRENSAEFRTKEMHEASVKQALTTWRPKLKTWYTDLQKSSMSVDQDDKLGFDEWLKALRRPHAVNGIRPRLDMCGEWEIEQLSEITADPSAHGVHIKCRLSVPACKAAFMDSQRAEQLGVGQAAANSAQTVLGFEEFCECVARCGVAKYLAVKQMDNGAKISAFVKNLLGEANEEDCMREVTTIRSVRYDASKSKPLQGESPEQHQAFLAVWAKVRLDGLYAFPLWEKDVLSLMHMSFKELSSIFRAYSKSLGETSSPDKAGSASTMSLDEFHDFVVDVGLETDNGVAYTFENMKALFVETNKSGKGLAGPAADSELELPEFLGLLVRCAFWRLNPEYGEVTMEHQQDLLPVPQCFKECIDLCKANARHDDAEQFRKEVMGLPGVTMSLYERKSRLQKWFDELATTDLVANGEPCMSMDSWIGALEKLQGLGTYQVERTSDIVGDERAGEILRCRLSLPRAKAAFVCAQREKGDGGADVTLDFDELQECIARCAIDKYRSISLMKEGVKVRAMIGNLLAEATEEAAMLAATHVTAERFDARAEPPPQKLDADAHASWLRVWDQMGSIHKLHGFPLWEKEVHDMLMKNFSELTSIFVAYAASSLEGDADTMDMDEFHDFVIETSLEVEGYGWNTMTAQYKAANLGSNDDVLEIHEFLTSLVRIAFYRANPQFGLHSTSRQEETGGNLALTSGHAALKGQGRRGASDAARKKSSADRESDAATVDKPLPGCLLNLLKMRVLPHARRAGDSQLFRDEILPSAEVQAALDECSAELGTWYELVSQGADYLSLEQWLRAIDSRQLLTDLTIHGHAVRLTEPQARSAFFNAAATPTAGLLPNELAACVVKVACDKYRAIETLSNGMRFTNGDKVRAFVSNMLGTANEEEALADTTPAASKKEVGPAASKKSQPAPARRAASPAAAAPAERSTEQLVHALRGKLADGHMLTELELAQMEAATSPRAHPPAAAPAAAVAKQRVTAAPASASGLARVMALLDSESVLPRAFFEWLNKYLNDGSGTPTYPAIADIVEGMSEWQPTLRRGLQQQQGVQLFTALDARGDGTIALAGLREALARAISTQPPLLEWLVKAQEEGQTQGRRRAIQIS